MHTLKKRKARLLITILCLVPALALVLSCGKKEEPRMLPIKAAPVAEPAPMEENAGKEAREEKVPASEAGSKSPGEEENPGQGQ